VVVAAAGVVGGLGPAHVRGVLHEVGGWG
jgi:hypothetical protein